MALLTTVMEIIGVLAAIATLLWLSTLIEARQLGPIEVVSPAPSSSAEPQEQNATVPTDAAF